MSNTQRPSTARKRTPADEKKREAELDQDYTIEVDGTKYTLVPSDITGLLDLKVRRGTDALLGKGMSVIEIIDAISESPGLDRIACFMYAAEVAAGRDADLEKILGSVSATSDFDIVDGKGEPVPQP